MKTNSKMKMTSIWRWPKYKDDFKLKKLDLEDHTQPKLTLHNLSFACFLIIIKSIYVKITKGGHFKSYFFLFESRTWAVMNTDEQSWTLMNNCGYSEAIKNMLPWCHELSRVHECSWMLTVPMQFTVLMSADACSWLPMSTQEGSWPLINAHECLA